MLRSAGAFLLVFGNLLLCHKSDAVVAGGKYLRTNIIACLLYTSSSITEFWRRWHISLGTWFRDYVYIPLGGNRVGKYRHLLNILAVWVLTGFWHGAAWNFAVWGLLFAVLLMAEKMWLLKLLRKHKMIARIYVLFFVLISFVLFNADNMGQAFSDLAGLFGAGGIPLASDEALYYLSSFSLILPIACLLYTSL